MNITRHNYEEFFMLYADDELSAEQRRAVEMFVEANPDLKTELDLFLSIKLQEDPSVTLEDKSFLFRKESTVADETHTQMLLHLDGELPGAQVASLEARINSDESLRKEWEILNQAKLLPEPDIRFPDRQLLYRHAESGARVLHIRWVRYAAAAAVALLAGLLWLNNPEQQDSQPGSVTLAADDAGGRQQPAGNPEGSTNATADNIPEVAGPALASLETGAPEKQLAAASRPSGTGNRQEAERVKAENTAIQQPRSESITPALAAGKPLPVETAGDVPLTTVQVSPDAVRSVQDITDRPAGMEGVKTDYATQALAMQANGQPDVMENTYQDNDREKKGLRGLVRKANRIFNKVTNPDLDRAFVKVANVEIGLGR